MPADDLSQLETLVVLLHGKHFDHGWPSADADIAMRHGYTGSTGACSICNCA